MPIDKNTKKLYKVHMSDVAERLQSYYPFSDEITETVADVAAFQKRFDHYKDYFTAIELPEPLVYKAHDSVETEIAVLDIKPRQDYDEHKARVLHLPMANPLDPNMLFQVATIYQSDPSDRLIAVGNPSGPGYKTGIQRGHDRRKSVSSGNLLALVDPILLYLKHNRIRLADHIGYSYGAEKAAVAADFGSLYRQYAMRSVHTEPVSVKQRNLLRLGADFAASNKALNSYVEASDTPAFIDARTDSVGPLAYNIGLMRATNLAIAKALGRGSFETRMREALQPWPEEPEMTSTIIWGTESKLAIDGLTQELAGRLQASFGEDRIRTISLPGQKHALANDIHLQAALVLEGLS